MHEKVNPKMLKRLAGTYLWGNYKQASGKFQVVCTWLVLTVTSKI